MYSNWDSKKLQEAWQRHVHHKIYMDLYTPGKRFYFEEFEINLRKHKIENNHTFKVVLEIVQHNHIHQGL